MACTAPRFPVTATRKELTHADLTPLSRAALGRTPATVTRIRGGSKKGVYRLTFDHPTDRLKYRYGNDWKDASEWKDTIKVRTASGVETRNYTFRESHDGPIIKKEDDKHYLAVKIAKLFDGSRIEQALAMTKAKNFDEWKAAFSGLNLQMFNTVYADVEGNIFYVYNGSVPRRDPSFDWTQPVDGAAYAVVEVHENPGRPECLAELLAAEHLIGPTQQELQGTKRQILNFDLDTALPEFSPAQVGLKDAEAKDGARQRFRLV